MPNNSSDFSQMDNAGISSQHGKLCGSRGMGFFTDAYDLYGFSFFFTEFGPPTTFVYPSEIFPVRVRTTGHGFAAAMGKLRRFRRGVPVPLADALERIAGCRAAAAIASAFGLMVTLTMLPETMGPSLESISSEDAKPGEKAGSAAA